MVADSNLVAVNLDNIGLVDMTVRMVHHNDYTKTNEKK